MPSLHVAWAVWVVTTLVVVATGNHYFLDAAAGALLACLVWAVVSRPGLAVSRTASRRSAQRRRSGTRGRGRGERGVRPWPGTGSKGWPVIWGHACRPRVPGRPRVRDDRGPRGLSGSRGLRRPDRRGRTVPGRPRFPHRPGHRGDRRSGARAVSRVRRHPQPSAAGGARPRLRSAGPGSFDRRAGTGAAGSAATRTPAGEWIISSRCWHETHLREGRLLDGGAELDVASADHPIFVQRGGHVAVANSAALRLGRHHRDVGGPALGYGGAAGRRDPGGRAHRGGGARPGSPSASSGDAGSAGRPARTAVPAVQPERNRRCPRSRARAGRGAGLPGRGGPRRGS